MLTALVLRFARGHLTAFAGAETPGVAEIGNHKILTHLKALLHLC